MKLIHIADVHWGAMPDRDQPWGKERAKEIKETFRRVLSYANEQKTDLLLISGDFLIGRRLLWTFGKSIIC